MCPAACPDDLHGAANEAADVFDDGDTETMDVVDGSSDENEGSEEEESEINDGMLFDGVEHEDGTVYVYYPAEFYDAIVRRIFVPLRFFHRGMQHVVNESSPDEPALFMDLVTRACELMAPYNDFISANGYICVHEDCQRDITELSKLALQAALKSRRSRGREARESLLEMLFLVFAFANHFLPEDDLDKRDLPVMLQFIFGRLQRDPTPDCLRRIYAHSHHRLYLFGDPDGRLHAPETAPVFCDCPHGHNH